MSEVRIALTGGIATGKTTVARLLGELGALIIDADAIARKVVRPGEKGWRALREFLDGEYFDEDGELRRKRLRNRIVDDPCCRLKVNQILHPFILEYMEEEWRSLHAEKPEKLIIFDIPLLFELNLASRFEIVIVVYVPRELQIQRLMARDGLGRKEAENTLHMQLPIDAKRDQAHILIDNSGTLDATATQVKEIWKRLTTVRR